MTWSVTPSVGQQTVREGKFQYHATIEALYISISIYYIYYIYIYCLSLEAENFYKEPLPSFRPSISLKSK